MATRLTQHALRAVVLALLLAGCEGRGQFGPDACDKNERAAVGGTAVLAIYFDKNGKEVGTDGEALHGTKKNTMCPAPPPPGPGPCGPGKCAVVVYGKSYCVPC
jgi:hypothetical protein